MTGRQTPRRNAKASSATKDEFVHECTCNVAMKQFRKDIEQLESDIRRPTEVSKPSHSDQTNCCTPVKKSHTSRYTANTPTRNRTWFDVLTESPRKPREKNAPQCSISYKYPSTFSNKLEQYKDNGDEAMKNDKIKQFNQLMDVLYKKVSETNNHELLNLVGEIKNVIQLAKTSVSQNNTHKTRPGSSVELEAAGQKYENSRRRTEKQSKELDDIKLKALVKLLENMQSVNQKTETHQESLENLTDLITKLCKENKMLTELKDNRIALESKLASAFTENKYLKLQVQSLENECRRTTQLLEKKDEEIANLKIRLGRIRETIARKIDFGQHSELDNRSVTLDLDDTIASAPSNNESFAALIRPASSSPIPNTQHQKQLKPRRPFEDEDSGIQSNAHENDKENRKDKVAQYNDPIAQLKNNVKKAMEEFKIDTKVNEVLLDLSDVTYRCSLSSLNFNS